MKIIIIQGSARSDGNTNKIVEIIRNQISCDIIDLKNYNISNYDYEHNNKNDDFLDLMRRIAEYDMIIFASPVYWYSMSGLMKTFFDRILDTYRVEKEIGEKLKGKLMATVACGSEEGEIEGFFIPFRKSADYLEMKYLGDVHTWIGREGLSEKVKKIIINFVNNFKI